MALVWDQFLDKIHAIDLHFVLKGQKTERATKKKKYSGTDTVEIEEKGNYKFGSMVS